MLWSLQEKNPQNTPSKGRPVEGRRYVYFDKFRYKVKFVTEKGFIAILEPGQYSAVVKGQQARAVVEVRDSLAAFAIEETTYVVNVNADYILCSWLDLPEKLANFLRLYASCLKARQSEPGEKESKRITKPPAKSNAGLFAFR